MEEYIIIAQDVYDKRKWFIVEKEIEPLNTRKIHKKHKDILDAYLEDSEVEIEYNHSMPDRWKMEFNFIEEYRDTYEYRLKQTKPQTIIKEFIDSNFEKPQTIKAPNSDVEFLKPEFECEILKYVETEETERFIGYINNNGIFSVSWDIDGRCYTSPSYSIEPYQKPKEWYEIEKYPVQLMNIKTNKMKTVYNNINSYKIGWRLATKSEVLELC